MFDIGGVTLNNGDTLFFPWIAKQANKSLEETDAILCKYLYPAEEDQYSEFTALEKAFKEFGLRLDPLAVQEKRHTFNVLNDDVAQLILKLKENYQVVYATNNTAEEFTRNFYTFDLGNLFDYGRASFHLKVRKTKKEFFEKYLVLLSIKSEELLFIDDGEKNLLAPASLGIQTIHFKNHSQLVGELRSKGINI